jgi:hypothetical protein
MEPVAGLGHLDCAVVFCFHLADRHPDLLFGVLPGRSGTFEAVVESGLCLSVLFLVMELKPRFLRS